MRSWILGLCLVLASLVARPAFADGNAKAKQLYDEGFRHFNVAEYPQAIDSWKQAYLISKKPLLLFNIAQAYRLSGDCKQAMTFYENYQNSETSIKNQDELDQAIAACKAAEAKPVEPKPVEPKPAEPNPTRRRADPGDHDDAHPADHRYPCDHAVADARAAGAAPDRADRELDQPPSDRVDRRHRGRGRRRRRRGVRAQGKSKANDAENVAMWDQQARDLQSAGQRDNMLAWGFGIAGGAAIARGRRAVRDRRRERRARRRDRADARRCAGRLGAQLLNARWRGR